MPIRAQLCAQILFGILSRRIAPAERLPSVRDLARRLKLHPNTVSAAYRDLAARGWVISKAGAGVFVRDTENPGAHNGIDGFAQACLEEGLGRGFSLDAILAAFEKAGRMLGTQQGATRLLVVHPDGDFAAILAAELQEAAGSTVAFASPKEASKMQDIGRCLLLTTTSGVPAVSSIQPNYKLIPLKSVEEMICGLGRVTSPTLIGIVSYSGLVLEWASRLIPVLGLKDSDVLQRNPGQRGWRKGLGVCDVVAADVLAAKRLPENIRPILMRLVPDSFLAAVRQHVTDQKV